jgi:hypothetical protein
MVPKIKYRDSFTFTVLKNLNLNQAGKRKLLNRNHSLNKLAMVI